MKPYLSPSSPSLSRLSKSRAAPPLWGNGAYRADALISAIVMRTFLCSTCTKFITTLTSTNNASSGERFS